MTTGAMRAATICSAADSPSSTGIFTSSRTRSGRSSVAIATAAPPVAGLADDGVALLLEHLDEVHADERLVLGDQHAQRRADGPRSGGHAGGAHGCDATGRRDGRCPRWDSNPHRRVFETRASAGWATGARPGVRGRRERTGASRARRRCAECVRCCVTRPFCHASSHSVTCRHPCRGTPVPDLDRGARPCARSAVPSSCCSPCLRVHLSTARPRRRGR